MNSSIIIVSVRPLALLLLCSAPRFKIPFSIFEKMAMSALHMLSGDSNDEPCLSTFQGNLVDCRGVGLEDLAVLGVLH